MYAGIRRNGSGQGQYGYEPPQSNVRQKFGSKERDAETGLDYFGARYFASVQGRFTSPDPLYFAAERLGDPQQFNLYAYVRNNPLRFIDPDGLRLIGYSGFIGIDLTEEDRKALEDELNKIAPGTKVGKDGTVIKPTSIDKKHAKGIALISRLVDSDKEISILVKDEGTTHYDSDNRDAASNGTGSDGTVFWNKAENITRELISPKHGIVSRRDGDNVSGLAHELIHGDHAARGVRDPRSTNMGAGVFVPNISSLIIKCCGGVFRETSWVGEHRTIGVNGAQSCPI